MEEEIIEGSQEPAVEETIESTNDEQETSTDVEMSEAGTEAQPTDGERQSRSQSRIQELNKKRKEAQEEAEYWRSLAQKQPDLAPVEPENGVYTAEQIADIILQKQESKRIEESKKTAAKSLQDDIQKTLEAHPDLAEDDDLAEIVFNFAAQKGISLVAAADRIKSKLSSERAKVEKRAIATQASKASVSSPQGSKVSNGEAPKPDVSNMTEDEKRANWNTILNNY